MIHFTGFYLPAFLQNKINVIVDNYQKRDSYDYIEHDK